MQRQTVLAAALALLSLCGGEQTANAATPQPQSRSFTFTYAAKVKDLPAGKQVRVWLPVATSNDDQTVRVIARPGEAVEHVEHEYGNHLLYIEKTADGSGALPLEVGYEVTRFEDRGDHPVLESDAAIARFLKADTRVPVGGKAMRLLQGKPVPTDQLAAAHLLYDVVDDHMTYRKDLPGWGFGDSDWACDSKFGNCTDFHSLFISLARAEKIPAKFEIGFMLGGPGEGTVAGYHCWAKFKPEGKGWIPVDISDASQHPEKRQANFGTICCNRIEFSAGRDLTLVPQQTGAPVNYLVYPYVEVDGKVWPQEKIEKHFGYKDAPTVTAPGGTKG